jgi:hypothetical protein
MNVFGLRILPAAALLAAAAVSPAQAAIINLTSFLSPANEVTPPSLVGDVSNATGGAGLVFSFDTDTNLLSWTISFEGLTGPATAAHFHSGAADVNGDIEINLDTGVNNDDAALNANIFVSGLGSQAGLFQGNGELSAAQETALMSDKLYINIHTDLNPGGEIRGQVLGARVVPVPAAVWLFGSGLLGLVGIARRKRS